LITPEGRLRLSLSRLGDKNPNWKGDNVRIKGLNYWVRRYLPIPDLCQFCNKRAPYDLANITGIYRRDFAN
jgi:hypothetical protein